MAASLNVVWASCLFSQGIDDAYRLAQSGAASARSGNYSQGVSLLGQAYSIASNRLGPNHPDTAGILADFAEVTRLSGDYRTAAKLCERAVEINERLFGAEHPQTLGCLNSLAHLRQDQGAYSKAAPLYERILAVKQKTLGPNHPELAGFMTSLTVAYVGLGRHDKALSLCKRALAISEETHGAEHPETAAALNALARIYLSLNQDDKAIPLYQRILAVQEKTLGPWHPELGKTANDLATAYKRVGNYERAIDLYKKALAINERTVGDNHKETATVKNNLGLLYCNAGDSSKGIQLLQEALATMEATLGTNHPEVASCLTNLAGALGGAENESEAIALYERALRIKEKSLGKAHPSTANTLSVLADKLVAVGDYAKALPLAERALSIREKQFGTSNVATACSLSVLAMCYNALGSHEKALEFANRALATSEATQGPDHPDTAFACGNLAIIYASAKDYSNAEKLHKRALQIQETALGADNPETCQTLRNLAVTYAQMRDYATAWQYSARAYEIERTKSSASGEGGSAHTVFVQAWLTYETTKDYTQALPLLERAIELQIAENGEFHRYTAYVLEQAAEIAYRAGDLSRAKEWTAANLRALDEQVGSVLLLDERSRMSWQALHYDNSYACFMPAAIVADTTLLRKGVVLDSVLEDRALNAAAKGRKGFAKKLNELHELRSELLKTAFLPQKRQQSSLLENKIAKIQRELTGMLFQRPRSSLLSGVSLERLVSALPGNSVFIDFLPFNDPMRAGEGEDASCYAAIIISKDVAPILVRIDGRPDIDRAVNSLRVASATGDQIEIELQSQLVSERLWQPISTRIPEGAKQIIICADADLNFLSFASLLESDGRFVAEEYSVAYVGSGRDLLRRPEGEPPKSMAVFADPAFDTASKGPAAKQMTAMRSAETNIFGKISLPPLPGTKAEAQQIESIAKQSGWDVHVSTDDKATESSVKSTKKPGVLHLATHGFYLNSLTPVQPDDMRGMSVVGIGRNDKQPSESGVDPMRASGVALTGARQTLQLWSERKAPNPETDGILTAEEVASLDLNGTWLVTLSACETGVGEARGGEGVFGLRRAFMIAGAENLLMTLWPVADDTTASIMADFYKEALATGDAPGSLAKVQRDWLVKIREEKGLAAAIREAGPFAMVMMTAPTHPPVELPPIAKLEANDTSTPATTTQPAGEASSE
ncbi:MAG: tetratricopeptide repeat protein [Planctomycetes bacterium]|nr:tetratricopeptide repeat protein [Planctomycetota bacterium]